MNTTTNTNRPININLPGVIEVRYIPGDPNIESCISLDIKDADALRIHHVHAIIKMLEVVYPEAGDNLWFELRKLPEIYEDLAEEDNLRIRARRI